MPPCTELSAKSRKRWLIDRLWLASVVVLVAIGAVNIFRFPYSIRAGDGGFYDKFGSEHTQAQYEACRLWRSMLPISFVTFSVLHITVGIVDGRRRRRAKPNETGTRE